jgi:hypothetical protein
VTVKVISQTSRGSPSFFAMVLCKDVDASVVTPAMSAGGDAILSG